MKRALIMLSGLVLAGLYAAIMYAIYGNLNWNSETEKMIPWFEPVFWFVACSGLLSLGIRDLVKAIHRWGRSRQ